MTCKEKNKYTCPQCKEKLRTIHDLIQHITLKSQVKCIQKTTKATTHKLWKQAIKLNKTQEKEIPENPETQPHVLKHKNIKNNTTPHTTTHKKYNTWKKNNPS